MEPKAGLPKPALMIHFHWNFAQERDSAQILWK